MRKIIVLGSLLVSAFILSAPAQNTRITPVQIKPVDVQKIVAAKNLGRMTSLANTEKMKQVRELLKNKVEPAKLNSLGLFSPVTLTVQNPVADEKAFLVFDFPETISAYENKAVFSPSSQTAPKLKVFFNAPAAGFYVFDFYLAKGPTGSSKSQSVRFAELLSGVTERPLDAPQYQHQLFAAQVKNPGWNMVWLESENAVWSFIGAEISQAK